MSVRVEIIQEMDLEGRLRELESQELEIGLLDGGKGSRQHPNADMTVAELGAVHEFGAPRVGIPTRSFLGAVFDRDEQALGAKMDEVIRQALFNGQAPQTALQKAGDWFSDQVKNYFTESTPPPPIKPETAERKGSNLVLVETGTLREGIEARVTAKGAEGEAAS